MGPGDLAQGLVVAFAGQNLFHIATGFTKRNPLDEFRHVDVSQLLQPAIHAVFAGVVGGQGQFFRPNCRRSAAR